MMSSCDRKRKRKPGKRCVVMFCDKTNIDGVSLHQFPKDVNSSRKWSQFVLMKREGKTWTPGTGHICSDHFLATDYEGYGAKLAGFSSKLMLRNGAVPSVQATPTPEQLQKARKTSSDTPPPLPSSSTTDYASSTPRSTRRGNALTKLRAHRTIKQMEFPIEQEEKDSGSDVPESAELSSGNPALSPFMVNKATQKSLKKPERRSRADQTSIEQKEIAIQCNMADLPPLGLLKSSYSDESDEVDSVSDEMYSPSTSDTDGENDHNSFHLKPEQRSIESTHCHGERKFIVFESSLLELFKLCPVCNSLSEGSISEIQGTFLRIVQKCTDPNCTHNKVWTNQKYVGTMPVGNLLLSAAIMLSGLPTEKTLRMFKFMNIACVSRSSLYRHTSSYVNPIIMKAWKKEQGELLQQVKDSGKALTLTGDGRCDSPGHSAKYGSYTMIEQNLNRVLDFQLVQSNEVKNSSWMEVEGLKRSVALITGTADLTIETLITDRSTSVSKYVREKLKNTKHYYDIWHVAKGLAKKIDKLAKKKDFKDIGDWKQSICNHMYWCAASTPDGNGELMKAKWEMLPLHIQEQHEGGNALYPKCGHGELQGESLDRLWFEKGSPEAVKLEELLLKKQVLKDVSKLSPKYQTSTLEAKHSLDIQFVPKHTAYSYWGMQTRLCLSALHYNENADRMQAINKDGMLCYSIRYPKAKKGKHSVRPQKTKATYDYCKKAIDQLFEQYRRSPKLLRLYMDDLKQNTPPPLTASIENKPDKEDAIHGYVSRYYRRQIIH